MTVGVVAAMLSTVLVRAGATDVNSARLSVPEDRYAMAGGCYAVQSLRSGGYIQRIDSGFAAVAQNLDDADSFLFQATDLGSYLLYNADRDFFAASDSPIGEVLDYVNESIAGRLAEGLSRGASTQASDAIAHGRAARAAGRGQSLIAADRPSELADWEIDQTALGVFSIYLPSMDRFLAANAGGALRLGFGRPVGDDSRFGIRLTGGCVEFPEVEVNVTGPVATGPSAFAEVRGFFDAHVHMMAYEFIGGRVRCGKPWHRYGPAAALVDCPDHEPGGAGAVWEQLLAGGPGLHDTAGWPTFPYWPKNNSLTHEQIYYKWLERAWRGGLRLMTNLLVDNAALCNVYPYAVNSCNEMDGVRLQAKRLRELERYIDAQAGGPGEGWFRIVTDPFQARSVINAGKLAVIMGIEVSTPLDCGLAAEVPLCDNAKIDAELDAVYEVGVRQMEMANKFDNALTGVTGDAGAAGIVVNTGNQQQTGRYWQMKTCDDAGSDAHDKQQLNLHDDSGSPDELTGRDSIFAAVLSAVAATGAAPVYPPGPHCNIRGLSDLGKHFLQGMVDRGMIFDPDHMSALARTQAMDFLKQKGYAGIVSSHSWADDTIYPRVIEQGGMVAPHAGGSTGFIAKWRKQRQWADPRYFFGVGFGSDVNGFSVQGRPRGADAANKVTYPFTGFGGVTIDKQRSGQRVYDVNLDGVAHYGLYPDWVEDIRRQAGADGPAIVEDLSRAAEAYLQTWERAAGVPANACRPDVPDLAGSRITSLRAGASPEAVLRALGQPRTRDANGFTYCLERNRIGHVVFEAGTLSEVKLGG